MICLRHIPAPHTGEVVFRSTDSILKEFGLKKGISDEKLFLICTDNGSNMIAAYQNSNVIMDNESDIAITTLLDEDSDEEMVKSVMSVDEIFNDFDVKKRLECFNHILNNNLKVSVQRNEIINDLFKRLTKLIRGLKNKAFVNDYFK